MSNLEKPTGAPSEEIVLEVTQLGRLKDLSLEANNDNEVLRAVSVAFLNTDNPMVSLVSGGWYRLESNGLCINVPPRG